MTAVFAAPAAAHGFPDAGCLQHDGQNRLTAQQTRSHPVFGQNAVFGSWDNRIAVHGYDPDAELFQFSHPQL